MSHGNKLIKDFGGKCYYCGGRIGFGYMHQTVDHYFPLSKGGSKKYHNKVLACSPCNQNKADLWPAEFQRSVYLKTKIGYRKKSKTGW